MCANIPVTMSANSDKLISDFRNSWCNNCRIPWKSDVIGLRPSNSTWITYKNSNDYNFIFKNWTKKNARLQSTSWETFLLNLSNVDINRWLMCKMQITSFPAYASLSSLESELYESSDSSPFIFLCLFFVDIVYFLHFCVNKLSLKRIYSIVLMSMSMKTARKYAITTCWYTQKSKYTFDFSMNTWKTKHFRRFSLNVDELEADMSNVNDWNMNVWV